MLYIHREIKHGQKVRGKENAICLFIGRFNSINAAKKARDVRWNYGLDEDIHAGLVRLLAASKGETTKRKVSEVSPADGDGDGSRTPQPLVGISANVPTENTRSRRSKGRRREEAGATISSPATLGGLYRVLLTCGTGTV